MSRARATSARAETRYRRQERESLLAQSHRALAQRLDSFVHEMPLGCIIWDEDGRVIEWNRAAERIFGWSEAEAFQRRYSDLIALEEDSAARNRLWQDLLDGSTPRHQGEARTRNGSVIECEWFHTVLADEAGKAVAVASMVRDVTERRTLEQQLLRSQKLEAVAILAGGIAHDFNNLLTSVLGNVSLAMMKLGPSHEASRGLRDAEVAAERASELTRQLLRFSRKAPAKFRPADLNETVREVVSLLEHSVAPEIRLETRLDPELWNVEADPGQLAQLVMNLCVNARDAIHGPGQIRIESANRKLDRAFCKNRPEARPGEFVELIVGDDGSGMNTDTLEHLFEPFFTTKDSGHGTGLGLATVYLIVRSHNGWINVSSRAGKGSTFRVYLPRTRRRTEPQPAIAEADPRGVKGTILIADDEEAIRRLTAEALERNGHQVIQVSDGRQALEAFRKARETIRLVVLDLKMPRMSGWRALERIRRLDPDVPVLLTSGTGLDEEQREARMRGAVGLVPKPYRVQTLLSVVSQSLSPSAARGHGPGRRWPIKSAWAGSGSSPPRREAAEPTRPRNR